ncbi:MAG: Extracellular ligand-binding receptor [Candidatus Angelobacter sp.]|nr:Extracellular ligand-binding receptor [Candidatus Angelobacter sp.]
MTRDELEDASRIATVCRKLEPGCDGKRRGIQFATVLFSALLTVANLLGSARLVGQELAAQEAGKRIYLTGESPSYKPLEAVLGEGSTVVSATLMPCASCHGREGKGRTEGGIVPSDITWSALTRPSSVDNELGRRRPGYDVKSLRKVLREGVDSGGNELGPVMPRYRIADEDLAYLIDYLQLVGRQNDPGLTETTIRAGTIIPAGGPLAAAGESFSALLQAYFDDLNQQGGIYGRKVELEVLRTSGASAEIAAAADDFVKTRNIFAVVSVLAPEAERELREALERSGSPVIDAFTSDLGDSAGSTNIFHILSGLPQQSRALLKFAQNSLPRHEGKIAIVYPESRRQLAASVIEECVSSCIPLGYSQLATTKIASFLAKKSSRVVFLGSGSELQAFLAAAKNLNWSPDIFQPGPLADENIFLIPQEFIEHVFLSFPTLPADVAPQALEEYVSLVNRYKLKHVQPARGLSALASAKVFTEALRIAGRQLGREQLIAALSSMYNFSTGLTPPITYTTTRRTGALGAHVVKLDLKNKSFIPLDSWIVP